MECSTLFISLSIFAKFETPPLYIFPAFLSAFVIIVLGSNRYLSYPRLSHKILFTKSTSLRIPCLFKIGVSQSLSIVPFEKILFPCGFPAKTATKRRYQKEHLLFVLAKLFLLSRHLRWALREQTPITKRPTYFSIRLMTRPLESLMILSPFVGALILIPLVL